MMYWYDHGGDGWGWGAAVMGIGMMLFWALLVVGIVLLVRTWSRTAGPPAGHRVPPAENILAERYARGEIDEDEYRRRLATLRGTPPPPPMAKS